MAKHRSAQKKRKPQIALGIAKFLTFLLVVLLPFVISSVGLDKFRLPKSVLVSVFTLALALCLLVAGKLEFRFRRFSWELLLLISLGYLGVHTLISRLPWLSLSSLLQIVIFVLLFFCIKSMASPDFQRNLWLAGGLAIGGNAVVAVLQYFGLFWSMVDAEGQVISGRTSAGGLLGEVNSAGFLFALVSLTMLYFIFVEKAKVKKILGAIAFGLNLVGLAFTQTLTAILTLGVVAGFWLIFHHWWLFRNEKRLTKGVVSLWIVLALGGIGAASLGYKAGVADRLFRVMNQMKEGNWMMVTSGRQPVYYLSWEMVKEHPLLGTGLSTFGREFFYFRTETEEGRSVELIRHFGAYRQAHNEYLQAWTELGFIGLCLLVVLLVLPILHSLKWIRKLEKQEEVYWIFLLNLGVLFTAVSSLAFFPFHLPATGFYVVLLFACLRAYEGLDKETEVRVPASPVEPGLILKYLMVLGLVIFVGYAQLLRWQRNNELGIAAYVLERAAAGDFTPAQQRMFADESLVRLERVDPFLFRNFELYNLKGTAFMLLGRYEDAINNYQIATDYLPSPEVFVNLAVAYMSRNDWDRARECLEVALRYEPRFGRAHLAMQQVREYASK